MATERATVCEQPAHRMNPLAPVFVPSHQRELENLYWEHLAALTHQNAIQIQMDEVHNILMHGYSNGDEPDNDHMGNIQKQLMFSFMDAVDERARVIDVIEQNYGQAALVPIEQIDQYFRASKERKAKESQTNESKTEEGGCVGRSGPQNEPQNSESTAAMSKKNKKKSKKTKSKK